MTFNPSAANPPLPTALAEYKQALEKLGIGGSGAILSPTGGAILDWMDYPQPTVAYARSFPHNGPMDKRTEDWEAQTEPSRNPRTKRPRGPGESVLLS